MTATVALVVPADPSTAVRFHILDSDQHLQQLQQLVGGLIVTVPHGAGRDLAVWANEEGIDRGLPINRRASAWWDFFHAEHHQVGDVLRGDVVFEGARWLDGEDFPTDVDPTVVVQVHSVRPVAVAR